jgi:hypothetical protein
MNDHALFVVASPLQALSANEAQHFFGENAAVCDVIIIPGSSERATKQIRRTLEGAQWRSVEVAPPIARSLDLKRWSQTADDYVRAKGAPRTLYLGDFRNMLGIHVARKYRPSLVLLDDGSALHRFVADRDGQHRTTGQTSAKKPAWLVGLFRRLRYGLSFGSLPALKIFTIYDRLKAPAGDTLVANLFTHLRKAQPIGIRRDDEVFVVGGCLAELGVVSLEFYEAQMAWIAARSQGKKVSYIPHRREDRARYESYQEKYGFSILEVDVPIELLVLEQGWAPGEVIGFYSTALDTLHLMTEDCGSNIVALRIPDDRINTREDAGFISEVYRYFSGYPKRFEIVDLSSSPAAAN